MEQNFRELIEISRYYGANKNYVIAGGGNTSFKNDEKLWVKASGFSLDGIDENGFVCLDRKKLQIIANKKYSSVITEREQEVKRDLNNAVLHPKSLRPSVETSMHEIIRYPYVVHTHPTLVNGMLCAGDSQGVVSRLFGNNVLYIPYIDPGYTLFKAVDKGLKKYRTDIGNDPNIIFLENHGVFVAGESSEEIRRIYADIDEVLTKELVGLPDDQEGYSSQELQATIDTLHNVTGSVFIIPHTDELTLYFVQNEENFRRVATPFTPDNIVYCKSHYLFLKNDADVGMEYLAFSNKYGYYPKVTAVEGKGILALEENERSARIVLDVFKDMMKVAFLTQSFGGSRPLNQQQIDFIDNWEVENYRRKISKGKKVE